MGGVRGARHLVLSALLLVMVSALLSSAATAAPPPAPSLVAPANGADVLVPFSISWSQVLDPSALNGGYNWEVSSSSDFSLPVLRDSTRPSETQATVSGLVNGTYFWRVQAVNATVETGPWSSTRSFRVTGAGPGQPGVPTLNQPQGGTQFHPHEAITWTWSAVSGAASYTAEWSQDSRFLVNGTTYLKNTNIPGTRDGMAFHDSLQGTWFMRVRAVNADGVAGNPSNVITFSVLYGNPVGPPPSIIAPTGNPTLTLPITLSWTDGYNPQDLGYEVQISSSSSFTTIEQPTAGHTDPRRVVSSLTSGPKFWRVRSHQGSASPTTAAITAWSATGTFTVSSAPPVPASVTLSRDPLYSGAEQRLSVQLTGPAPAGGAVVSLASSDRNALPVPSSLTIDEGFAVGGPSPPFLFAGQVTTPTPVTVTATYGGSSASTTITVMPPTLKSDPLQPEVRATGGATMTGRLDLAGGGFAPAGGFPVGVSSSSPAATVPATVTIPAGANSTAFTIQTKAVTTTTVVTIRATHGAVTAEWQLTLTPAPAPTSLTLRPVSTTSGSQGIVTIATGSIAGHDQLLRVASSNPAVASVGEFARVPASTETGRFDIVTSPVSEPTPVTISVSGGGVTLSSTLTVYPSLPALTALTVNPTSVPGGTPATGTVTLSSAAPTGGVAVSLGSNLPGSASVPTSVTVPAGATSATFTVTTYPVQPTTVQLSASLDSVFKFAALSVTREAAGPTLSALTLSPSSVVGGTSSTGTVTLSAAAPSGGAVVTLSDDSPAATVPASVTVAAGATSRTFTVTTSSVTSSTAATISGSSGGATRSTTLTVVPPTPAAPTLLSPAQDATVPQPVLLDWSDVGAATSYRIQIDDSSTFSSPLVVDRTVTASQFTAPSLGTERHWWRVRGINSAGTAGPWSTVRRFTPQAATSGPAALSGVSVSPARVTGGASSQGAVSLTSAAPAGGLEVALTSSSTAATVPATVTVAAGASTASFAVTTRAVTTSTPVTITAGAGGVTRSTTLTVDAPATTATLTVTATGRSGERVTSSPAGINVTVGSSGSASFASGTVITLSATNSRDVVWSGACSSGGSKTKTCTFTISGNASVGASVQ